MDFFEHQEQAHRKTGRLVVVFFIAVAAITALAYAAVATFVAVIRLKGKPNAVFDWSMLWDPALLLWVGLGTVAVVAVGSMVKVSELRAGGRVIADALGGRLIDPSSADATERKVLNVVEEMAIASGTPVPPVYVMDNEAGINAFAAGYSPSDAVIGVTRGCAELLNRDELQGVIAHEFSHILNGDMRLNIRLMGVIHGILVIGLLGSIVMRSAFFASAGRSRRSSKDSGGGALALVALGVALVIIGFLGVFFAKLIKASVSRQREYLADAAAVQFTRYPDGIGGALKKIGGYTFGSKVLSPSAEEVSHMFFGAGVTSMLGAAMSTHPPLPQRIGRIDPQWDGKFPEVQPPQDVADKAKRKRQKLSRPGPRQAAAVMPALAGTAMMADPARPATVNRIGRPTQAHLQYAHELVAKLPGPVKQAAHEPFGARAVIYALLLDTDADTRRQQLARLKQHADPQVYDETRKLEAAVQKVDENARLPLIDMALPALRELAPGQYEAFKQNMLALIHADDRIDLFEWVLRRIILFHLDPQFHDRKLRRVRYYSLKPFAEQCSLLLSILAYVGHDTVDEASKAFNDGGAYLAIAGLALVPQKVCSLDALDDALDAMGQVGPRDKRKLAAACAACICADRQVTVREGELLRAICDSLGCPVPPLLPGQPLM